ncbi:hypothetical protein DFH94DRAFT_209729 [Russula ochroleuca]|uniref:Uncharacterized protein n=1 Tax=Russula ochroleuca TaxID=152965 RepID=A0A9P5JYA1_9AGAM|nr:hypothetical protein DFH94DRAFT_209729 [Russula ochroleuca]
MGADWRACEPIQKFSWGLEADHTGWAVVCHATFFLCPFNASPPRPVLHFPPFPSSHTTTPTFLSFPPPTPSHMSQKTGGQLVHLQPHPPFPSFSWVMTAEANPPSPAYAFGYVRNARAQSGKHTRPPARRTVPPGHQQQPQYPRPTRPAPAPPATRAKAGAVAAEHDDNLMVNPSTFAPSFFFLNRQLNVRTSPFYTSSFFF